MPPFSCPNLDSTGPAPAPRLGEPAAAPAPRRCGEEGLVRRVLHLRLRVRWRLPLAQTLSSAVGTSTSVDSCSFDSCSVGTSCAVGTSSSVDSCSVCSDSADSRVAPVPSTAGRRLPSPPALWTSVPSAPVLSTPRLSTPGLSTPVLSDLVAPLVLSRHIHARAVAGRASVPSWRALPRGRARSTLPRAVADVAFLLFRIIAVSAAPLLLRRLLLGVQPPLGGQLRGVQSPRGGCCPSCCIRTRAPPPRG